MFTLTNQERQVVAFLAAMALVGLGADFLIKKYIPAKSLAPFTQDLGKIDLNRADKQLLMAVPGIGEKLAGRIIAYRQKQSGFQALEELKSIQGITEYRYEKIKGAFFLRQ
ncbi:MAG: helix-hairpin-helix domain-containing protein [Candidatus Omnitrophica bacterium]|nr:helix-hairpin-helix domain-containing protein [Candidatus Omnitrophota bacterium]